MEEILQILLEEFHSTITKTEHATHRDYQFPRAENMIKVAVGMRRSGKTYFLYQTIRTLISQGVTLQQILFINFEDDRLLPLNHKKMGELIDAFFTLYPENHHQRCYVFLDEVQNVEEWPLVIRRLSDTKNIQIYLTGSSAKLLSKEIATSLRGRSLAIEILPYSYSEFLAAHHLDLPKRPFGKQSQDVQRSYLINYLKFGGFPAVQSMEANEQLDALQNYVETVVFRDIVERHKIGQVALLKYMINMLLKSVAAPFSLNKFYNDIKSQGYKVGKDTLYAYLKYLEDAYLIFAVPIFSESLRSMQTTPKKIYAIDNGLNVANTFNLSDNFGKLLENLVYLDLRRQEKKIFYYKTSQGFEIDFIVRDKRGMSEIIQVVWDAQDAVTMEREKRALREAEAELGISGRIIDWSTYIQGFI